MLIFSQPQLTFSKSYVTRQRPLSQYVALCINSNECHSHFQPLTRAACVRHTNKHTHTHTHICINTRAKRAELTHTLTHTREHTHTHSHSHTQSLTHAHSGFCGFMKFAIVGFSIIHKLQYTLFSVVIAAGMPAYI